MRSKAQDELDPRCVWMVNESDEDARRCMKQAKWTYLKKITAPNKLPSVETYTMCGLHASEKNRSQAQRMGYTVREIPQDEQAPHS